MPLLTRRALVMAKIESVSGTAETLAAADDAIQAINPDFQPDVTTLEREIAYEDLSPAGVAAGRKLARMTFSVEAKSNGSTDDGATTPRIGQLLRACGFSETLNDGTDITYVPVSTNFETATIEMYFDGLKHLLTGAMGTFTLEGEAGRYGRFNFEFTGLWNDPTDMALPSATYETTKPPKIESSQLTVDGNSDLVIGRFSFDMGIQINERPDVNSPEGVKGIRITGRQPTGGIDPEATLVADEDFWGKLSTAKQMAVSGQIGSTAGNIIAYSAPKVQYTGLTYRDRNGIRTYDAGLRLGRDTGNDEFQLVFK